MEHSTFSDQLRLAVMTAGAAWCAGLEAGEPVAVWGSGEVEQIAGLVGRDDIRGWLEGAGETGRVRSRKLPVSASLPGCRRITVFPVPETGNALLVGSPNGRLDPDSRNIFKSLSRRAGERFPDDPGAPTAPEESARAEFMRVAEQIGGLDITELDLESVLKRSVERSRELAGGTGAELGLIDARTGTVRVLWSEIPGSDVRQYSIPIGEDVIGKVAESGRPLTVSGYSGWPDRTRDPAPFAAAAGIPLKYKGALIGALAVVDDDPDRVFSDDDVRMLKLLASQVSVSIRNARLFQELGDRIRAQRAAEGRIAEAARLAAIGEMAAGIAHELNNPLTSISGFTELLLEEFPEGSTQHENMSLVLSEARRARQVVRRLLDFSRRDEELKGPINLTETISEVLALAGPMAQTQEVEIRFEAWEDLPPVFGDGGQLRQVIMNLVTNAIQAMPEGGTLSIRTYLEDEPAPLIAIRIRDTGAGIPAEHVDQVFDPFFTTKPVGTGTGLGLSISRSLVAEHGGDIRVESEAGEGACFTVLLPPIGDET